MPEDDEELDAELTAATNPVGPSLDEIAAQFDVPVGVLAQYIARLPGGLVDSNLANFFLASTAGMRGATSNVRERQALRNAIVHAPQAQAEAQASPPRIPESKSPKEQLLKR